MKARNSRSQAARPFPLLHTAEEQARALSRVARRLRVLERKLRAVTSHRGVIVRERQVARGTRQFVATLAGRIERRVVTIREREAAWDKYVGFMMS